MSGTNRIAAPITHPNENKGQESAESPVSTKRTEKSGGADEWNDPEQRKGPMIFNGRHNEKTGKGSSERLPSPHFNGSKRELQTRREKIRNDGENVKVKTGSSFS